METEFEMVAKTFQGLEDVLAEELIALGAKNVEPGLRMVSFHGDNEILYKANLCCRTALRILKPIVKFKAENPDELYDYVRELEWEDFMDKDSTFSIDSTVNGDDFTHSRYVTYRVKDGIVDHFNDRYGSRPSIRLNGADIELDVHIAGSRVTISLNSSGESLSKRGYRKQQTQAPINEVLAAGIILKTGWRGDCDLLDPMCGSGTFLIEAALIAGNINPGIYRESFAFEKWPDFDKELFEELYNDDSAEKEFAYKIYGGDIDPDAVAISRANIKSARVEEMIELKCCPFTDWTENSPEGVLVTNPPYGERLKPENLSALYKTFGTLLKKNFSGWHAWVIGYQEDYFHDIGLRPSLKVPLFNGSLECSLREYVMFDGGYSEFRSEGGKIKKDEEVNKGPKKVRHISDDEWVKTTKRFQGTRSKDGKDSMKKVDKNDRRSYEKDTRRMEKSFADTDENAEWGEFKEERRDATFRKPKNRDFGRNNRDGKRSGGDGFRRDNRKDSGRGDRPFRGNGNDRNFSGKDRRDDRREGRRNDTREDRRDNRGNFRQDRNSDKDWNRSRDRGRDRERNRFNGNSDRRFQKQDGPDFRRSGGPSTTYKPSNSKEPAIPESQETVINPVHIRHRKNRATEEES